MGESLKFPKSLTLEIPILNQMKLYNLSNSAFWGWLSMESQPQNPEFRINPENFHPFVYKELSPVF